MIPRVIHRIWLGSEDMPGAYQEFGETWTRHHPAWELWLWTDENLPEFSYPEAFERGRNPAERSDVLRYEVLSRFGGLYVDTDVECKRPLDPLIAGVTAFAAWERPDLVVGTGMVGATAGHPAMKRMVDEIRHTVGTGRQDKATGPGLLTRVLVDFPEVTIFPAELFHPYHVTELYRRDEDFSEAYAIHHWSGSWKTREDYRAQIAVLQQRATRLKGRVEKLEEAREQERQRRREAESRLKGAKRLTRLTSPEQRVSSGQPTATLERATRRPHKVERRAEDLASRLAVAEKRLSAIESSRWWRLGKVLVAPSRAIGHVGRVARRDRQISR